MLNPFGALERDYEIFNAARAGVFTAGWLGLSYVIATARSLVWEIQPDGSPVPIEIRIVQIVICLSAVVAAGFLGWRIRKHCSFWASVVALAWLAIELAVSLVSGSFGIGVITLIAGACGILSVRGTAKLRAQRRISVEGNSAASE